MAMLPLFASSPCFAFREKQSGKYVQCVYRKKAGGSRIEASADTVIANARTRFFVEPSEEEEGLVHIRCCYNNKYWVPLVQEQEDSRWIIATANEPEEDLSSPSCTLFQPIPVPDDADSIRFLHSGRQTYACVFSIENKPYLQLTDDRDDQGSSCDIFIVVGLSRQKELPKYVAFKGDNGKYLGTKRVLEPGNEALAEIFGLFPGEKMKVVKDLLKVLGGLYQQFHTEDIGDQSVIYTTFTNEDGTVRIMSFQGGFWKRDSDDWIVTEPVEDSNDRDTLFEVITGEDFVALRNLGNNKICKRLDANGKSNCLSACDGSTSQWAKLKLEAPVARREISDVKFHLDEARIYNKRITMAGNIIRTNDTSSELKANFSFVKKREVVTKWETSVSSKIGIEAKINFSTSGVPIIKGGEVTFSTEYTSSKKEETSESNTEETTITQEYAVPPRTTIAAKCVAMRASCDVPYSYKQTDVLTTGKEVTTNHNDGIYTVTNSYNFHISITDDKDEIKRLQA